jgi:predicted nucleotidyltransferase
LPVRSSEDVPSGVRELVGEVIERLRTALGESPAGAYLSGSLALGDFDPAGSDVDLFAVAASPLDHRDRRRIVDSIIHPPLEIPARGLEFVVYERDRIARPSRGADFAVNLNVGPQMPLHFSIDPTEEPAHWFVLDRAIVREVGRVVMGPDAKRLFAEIPRAWLLEALGDSLTWHADEEPQGLNSVLNAARSLHFVREGTWVSKAAAATWAVSRLDQRQAFEAALARRRGESAVLDRDEINRVLEFARTEVERALAT